LSTLKGWERTGVLKQQNLPIRGEKGEGMMRCGKERRACRKNQHFYNLLKTNEKISNAWEKKAGYSRAVEIFYTSWMRRSERSEAVQNGIDIRIPKQIN
jgi:hypothetical protein